MCSINHLEVVRRDINSCLSEIDLCDNLMECACCCFYLEKSKELLVNQFLKQENTHPKKITRIKIPLYPLPSNRPYFNFNGIETIIYNLLKTEKEKYVGEFKKYKSVLKVYYEKNSLFNLPVIQLEVIFLGRLNDKTIDKLWKSLKEEVLYFTGSVGDIDIIDIHNQENLKELLRIPLLIGCPEFKLNGLLQEHRFSSSQIKEMNYLHTVNITLLDMDKIINNNDFDLFKLQRASIEDESGGGSSTYSDEDLIRELFPDEQDFDCQIDELEDEDDSDELPF